VLWISTSTKLLWQG